MPGRVRRELVGRALRLVVPAGGELDVHAQREQRRGCRALRVDLGQGAFEDVVRERGLPVGEMDRGQRSGDLVPLVEPVEQLLGLLVPALSYAEIGEPDQRTDPEQRALAEAPQPDRLGERGVGLGPPAGGGEDAAVVGAAERRDRGQVAPLRDQVADPDPLVGSADVAGVLAGGEELAEDLLEHEEVVDLATGDGGERLVEQDHALLGAVAVDEARAEVGERD